MKLAELLGRYRMPSAVQNQKKNMEITGISYDSRRTKPGDLFVCIRGFQSDGHAFARAAEEAGAAAIIAERIPGRNRKNTGFHG